MARYIINIMKTIVLVSFMVMAMARHHRHHRRGEDDVSLLTKTQARTCAQYGGEEGKLFTIYNNVITCGDKLRERQVDQYPDPACCLVAPDTCASVNKDVHPVKERRLRRQDEGEEAPQEKQEEEVSKCLYCVQHPCQVTPQDHQSGDPVLCIQGLFVCGDQKDKEKVDEFVHNPEKKKDEYLLKIDRRRRLKRVHKHRRA